VRRGFARIILVAVTGACGPWQRAGTEPRPHPDATIPQLFDARAIYRSMGFLVGAPPLGFVASVRFLAGATPDSTLAVFALSLANRALSFRRSGDEFVAEYHVQVGFRTESTSVREIARDETVRVHRFQETLRTDESVIFQQFVMLRPGAYTVGVAVRDRNGPAASRDDALDTVPRLDGGMLGSPVAIYRGPGRAGLDSVPQLVVNPRATLPYGGDSLRFYVEGYGLPQGTRVAARAVDLDARELWHDTVALAGDRALGRAELAIPPGALPVGRAELLVEAVGVAGPARVRAPLLVSLSDQWAITNFDEVVSLLRYFDRQDLVAKLHAAAPEARATQWHEFFKATDPVPLTPENEALEEYFGRLGLASARFQEAGVPGWLTDRGEVFITLGEPDEVFDLGSEVTASGARGIRWEYTALRLTLYFQDQTGFGQYRLAPGSRAEYQRVLAQVRRSR
jgi:GWxTD domain-containing protein